MYIIRFQQCLTRSMTLIKMYFVSTIRKLTAEVGDKMAGKVRGPWSKDSCSYSRSTFAPGPVRHGALRPPLRQILRLGRHAQNSRL